MTSSFNDFYEILKIHSRVIEALDKFDRCWFIMKLLMISLDDTQFVGNIVLQRNFLFNGSGFHRLVSFSNWWNWCRISIKQFSLRNIKLITWSIQGQGYRWRRKINVHLWYTAPLCSLWLDFGSFDVWYMSHGENGKNMCAIRLERNN